MSTVLGVSGTYHDAAACLVVDGTIVAAIQEERLSREKNDPRLPFRAAEGCLAFAKLPAAALDRVVFYEQPFDKLERVLVSTLQVFPRSIRQFPRAMASQLGDKLWVLDQLAERIGVEREKVITVEHHRAHAASAFFTSPYERAAVLTVDGVGEQISTGLWRGDGTTLEPIGRIEYPHSLGLLYAGLTAYLGFEVNEGEYKVMGLAAYGTPRFRDEFAKVIRLEPDGWFELDLSYFGQLADADLGFGPKLEQLLGPRRTPYAPWDLTTERDQRYADIAATLQGVTEDALLALAREAKRRTGADALCLAGGVALNAVANARLTRESGFAHLYVQPAAGDAGGAMGAAILGALALGDPRPPALASAALGLPVDVDAAESLATELGFTVRRSDTIADDTAALVERGQIIALCAGRFEWGPRALGQRSILADPRDGDSRERLNRAIKRREPFRPFAPAVLAARAGEYFPGAPNDLTPFMTTVCPIADAHAASLAAVRHVDGTARVQTVTATAAPALAAVLDAFAARTGTPIVLNTSFNGAGEPIIASEVDALAFLLTHPIDGLVVENLLVTKGRA